MDETYKPIAERDMEEEAASKPKTALLKIKSAGESDGADERMLPEDIKKVEVVPNDDGKLNQNEKQKNGDAKLTIGE
ncbi:unnamed protein product, partial [Callosobruchus maculatus]